MNCNKCGLIIDKNSNYCPYCGEKIKVDNNRTYEDPFKDIRIDNTHNDQYKYQQAYSNQNKAKYHDDINLLEQRKNNNLSLVGLILGIVSIFINFFINITGLGIIIGLIAFILAIVGIKSSTRGLGISSLLITIFTFIINLIITIFIFVGSIPLTFQNGYETTIKNYLTDAFFCGFNEHRLTGYWINDSNELLYLDDEGNYYIYLSSEELTDNYYYGDYEIEEGLEFNLDETLYADDDYYYYRINTLFNKTKIEGQLYYETITLIEDGFTLKLDKENKNNLVLISEDTEIEFERR